MYSPIEKEEKVKQYINLEKTKFCIKRNNFNENIHV